MEEEKSFLQTKLENMPNIKTRIKKITTKAGKNMFVVETVITQFYSMEYLAKVLGPDDGPAKKETQSFMENWKK